MKLFNNIMHAKFFIDIGIFWSLNFLRDINVLFHWIFYVSKIPKVIVSKHPS